MKKFFNTKTLCRAGVIAALYATLTWVFSPVAFGPFQVRPAEALTILPLFFVDAIPALYVGCILANLLSGFGVYDIFLGSLATLFAAILTYAVGKIFKNNIIKMVLGGFFPVILNAVIIPFVIWLAAGSVAYFTTFLSLLLTQSVWVYVLGSILYVALIGLINRNVLSVDYVEKSNKNDKTVKK
ncbi:MAG: QueT transporter family protein [Clostridia bacterium]|nr:QueT transporter family protein [Clostridia bacterium]